MKSISGLILFYFGLLLWFYAFVNSIFRYITPFTPKGFKEVSISVLYNNLTFIIATSLILFLGIYLIEGELKQENKEDKKYKKIFLFTNASLLGKFFFIFGLVFLVFNFGFIFGSDIQNAYSENLIIFSLSTSILGAYLMKLSSYKKK